MDFVPINLHPECNFAYFAINTDFKESLFADLFK